MHTIGAFIIRYMMGEHNKLCEITDVVVVHVCVHMGHLAISSQPCFLEKNIIF